MVISWSFHALLYLCKNDVLHCTPQKITICKCINYMQLCQDMSSANPTVLEAGALGIAPANTASLPAPTGDSVVRTRDPCISWAQTFSGHPTTFVRDRLQLQSLHQAKQANKNQHEASTAKSWAWFDAATSTDFDINKHVQPQKAQQDAELMSSHCSLSSHVTTHSCTRETGLNCCIISKRIAATHWNDLAGKLYEALLCEYLSYVTSEAVSNVCLLSSGLSLS